MRIVIFAFKSLISPFVLFYPFIYFFDSEKRTAVSYYYYYYYHRHLKCLKYDRKDYRAQLNISSVVFVLALFNWNNTKKKRKSCREERNWTDTNNSSIEVRFYFILQSIMCYTLLILLANGSYVWNRLVKNYEKYLAIIILWVQFISVPHASSFFCVFIYEYMYMYVPICISTSFVVTIHFHDIFSSFTISFNDFKSFSFGSILLFIYFFFFFLSAQITSIGEDF